MNQKQRRAFVRSNEPDYTDPNCEIPDELIELIRKRYKARSCTVHLTKRGRRIARLNGSPFVKQGTPYARAVYSAVYGILRSGVDVDHVNTNKIDDRIANLQPLTHKEHAAKTAIDGSLLCGEDMPNAKLTEKQVTRLRRLYAKKGSPTYSVQNCIDELRLDVDNTTARNIIKGVWWKQVGGPLSDIVDANAVKRKLDEATVLAMRKRYAKGNISLVELRSLFKHELDVSTMTDLLAGRTYKEVGGPTKECALVLKQRAKQVDLSKELSRPTVRKLRTMYRENRISIAALREKMGLSVSCNTIALVIRGERFPEYGGPIKGKDY